jgi:hypothetical protein
MRQPPNTTSSKHFRFDPAFGRVKVSSASITETYGGAHFPAAVGNHLRETEVDGSVLATDEESAVLPEKSADAASI